MTVCLGPLLVGVAPAAASRADREAGTSRPGEEVLVEALVATVNQTVITWGEVDAEARIILLRRGGRLGAGRPVDDRLRAAVLQYLINQEVILAEARRLQLFQISDAEINAEVDKLIKLFDGPDEYQRFLARHGLSSGEVSEIVHRDLRVDRFLKSRVRMVSRLDADLVRRYYNEHP
ncbi:MAG: SurA N-terminal domain-containing protein, partial [Deltaproteobacteria bacterium]|nr:SurA N-terminal domain-containing protein [Deltaproteobacteria bacterium]